MSTGESCVQVTVRVTAVEVLPERPEALPESLLQRLCHRHNLGLDDAHAQLHAFEKRNPELLFENS